MSMTWYWWTAAGIGWFVVGIAILSFCTYLKARLTGVTETFTSIDDLAPFLFGVIVWPMVIAMIGMLLVNRFTHMGKEDREQDRSGSTGTER